MEEPQKVDSLVTTVGGLIVGAGGIVSLFFGADIGAPVIGLGGLILGCGAPDKSAVTKLQKQQEILDERQR